MEIGDFLLYEKMRAECYRLLSACFCLLKKDIFLKEDVFRNLKELLTHVCPEASEYAPVMERAFEGYTEEELLVDYARLFVGPFELLAPPYGSVYLNSEQRVMGDSTMETMRMYQEEGLSIDGEFNELPDHISAELEFMYYLVYREVESLEKDEKVEAIRLIEKQGVFLDRLLKRWIHPFCRKIKDATENRFYLAIADCLYSFVIRDDIKDRIPEDLRVTALQ